MVALSIFASAKTSTALIGKVCHQLKNSSTQVIATGGFKPSNIEDLKPYVEQNQIFAIAVSSEITRSQDPNVTIAQFLTQINELVPGATVKESGIAESSMNESVRTGHPS